MLFHHEETQEADRNQVEVILIRGLEDLPENVANAIGKAFNIKVFDPRWRTEEGLDEKTERLDLVVQKAIDEGKQPIVIGLSAGAAMMETYMLKYHHKIRHGYSVSGLLNPDLNTMDLSHLTSTSPGFQKVAEYLTEHLTPQVVEALDLPQKISAYNSPDDTVVPQQASRPSWIRNENYHNVGRGDHLESVFRALVPDIAGQIRNLKQDARFD